MCNSSFTLKDFCLNDKISSSTGRSAAAHISRTSHTSPVVFSAPDEIILFTTWLLLAATGGMSEKMFARPARRRTPTNSGRAVDNALNVIQSVVRLERGRHYRSRKCCSVRITCTVAANIFFKCKFENFLMVVSTMCPHIKVAELNTLSDGKGITGIHIAICQ